MRKEDIRFIAKEMPKSPKIGDIFFEGKNMLSQLDNIDQRTTISYFEVIRVTDNSVEYICRIEPIG